MAKRKMSAQMKNIASVFRGLYTRVASRLDVDPSYVSRVARGERQSHPIEAALERETVQIMKRMSANRNGSGRNGANHNGRKMKRLVTN